ncbi:relaxase/mobilization nuclease domain-containing protein [Actinomadura napierensis]|uniref:MobA/VirD2-like nuclease domain-containing protein n=1 Tax=Actinomadura napierensis TaxID=267854 RepID=A0ABN2ZW09_9ACTN
MIAKVSPQRGDNTVGLLLYLAGPGRHNEHVNQRVIAAADTLGVDDGTPLDLATNRAAVVELGQAMDSHRRAMGVEMRGGHVWHLSLSLSAKESTDERKLSDEQWAQAVRYVVEKMAFDDDSGRAPCRWVAVHHGKSVNGNEHVHLAVNLVREDGTFASIFRDRVRMSTIAADLERRFGLQAVPGRKGGGMPGLSRSEIERVKRDPTKAEPDRIRLARAVRAAAGAASSEADFVQRLRGVGVIPRPRYEKGDRTKVVGYSVALHPDSKHPVKTAQQAGPKAGKTEPMLWFGGGRLAPDLSLTRLREQWPDWETESEQRAALNEWDRTAARGTMSRTEGKPAGRARRPSRTYGPQVWQEAAQAVGRVRQQLAAIAPEDTALWAGAAREVAGVLAAWSAQLEADRPGPLAAAADALARSAQTTRAQPRARREGSIRDLRGVAMVCFAASNGDRGITGQLVLLQQMIRMIEALQEAHRARGQAQHAMALARVSRGELTDLQSSLAARLAAAPGTARPGPSAGSITPIPAPGRPPHTPPAPGRGGPEFGRG